MSRSRPLHPPMSDGGEEESKVEVVLDGTRGRGACIGSPVTVRRSLFSCIQRRCSWVVASSIGCHLVSLFIVNVLMSNVEWKEM